MRIQLLIVLFMLNGCSPSSTVKELRDPDFTQGCKVVEAGIKLGYMSQAGEAEVCKLKCSKTLPDGFTYKYSNPRTGCSASITKRGGKTFP